MNNNLKSRYFWMSVIVMVLFAAIFIRLFNLQIINGVSYREQSEKRLLQSTPIQLRVAK